MNATGIAAVIMAVVGLTTGVGGLVMSRRGQKDDVIQAAAAHKLAERVQASHEMESLVDRLEKALQRADAELAAERVENDRRAHEQANRCRAQLLSAMDTLHTMQAIVRDEIAVEAARTAGDDVQRHITTDHFDEIADGEEYP